MGKGKGAPPPIDPGESMGQYLFGQDFESYQGVTDPRLQERIIGAEEQFRPRYAALELQDIATFARGLEGREPGEGYAEQQAKVRDLEAQLADIPKEIKKPIGAGRYRKKKNPEYARIKEQLEREQSALSRIDRGQTATPGLFDLLEESGERASAMQRSSLAKQRAADVAALQEFAPQVVEAYRQADPRSAGLADLASARATQSLGLAAKGQTLLDSELRKAGQAEQKLLSTGGRLADLTPTEQEAVLKKSGIELSSLTPTEQEALLQQRGTEFLQSTGQLTPLEQRRAEQQARAASVARGRAMDESGLYGEMQARMAEELGKQEREIALGAQLAQQEAGMRAQRLGLGADILGREAAMRDRRIGLGADMLSSSERMAAQRRAEQLQKQQLGASLIGQEADIMDRRLGQAYSMQRGIAGDLGATILGRPSQGLALGGSILGQAQGQAAGPMGPQLFDPNVGINLALQQRGQDIEFQGMQAQARGAAIGGIAQGLGSYYCWVAREVYGIQNPRWLAFREWMLNDSPSWFRNLYIKYGERFAKFISNKPFIKNIIRKWMDTKIK